MIVTVEEGGVVRLDAFMKKFPELKNAVYYRVFEGKKDFLLTVRFYDKKKRWIRIGKK
jgi:hypothetical protein